MYNFIDVTEASESVVLPSEALQINGEYIENLIPGYRTLNVSGREAMSPELDIYETGVRDGSVLKSKRFPSRTILVKFQLAAKSNEEYREAFNKLAAILNVENAELIFNDEQDKFFVGTPAAIGEIEPGRNCVVGEFEILCTDPFKYSVIEYEAEPDLDENSILVNYNGTYKSRPTLVAEFFNENEASADGQSEVALTGNGDCGYVAFFTEDEKIIQLGNPDEVDGANDFAKSQTLVNAEFKKSNAWGAAAMKQWQQNGGVTSSAAVEQRGTIGMGVASYAVPANPAETSATLLETTSGGARPYFDYIVAAKAFSRTANSVKVTLSVTASLYSHTAYFGYTLGAEVYIGGAWRELEMNSGSMWRGKTAHTKSVTVTISGLTTSQTSITGIKFRTFRYDDHGTAGVIGETACASLPISAYVADTPETYYLRASDYGPGSNWHGPSISRTIPADATGNIGAENFTFSYAQKMSIGNSSGAPNQLGGFQAILSDANGKIICGVNVYKGGSGKKANLRFYVNNSVSQTIQVDLAHGNKYFVPAKSTTITKSGGTIEFNVCGIKKVFRDSRIASSAVTKITLTFSRFADKPPLSYNGLYWVKFVKNNCDTWNNVPNKFSANDIVEADCSNGEIRLNGVLVPALGALGNDWETFVLTPGLNQVGFAYSEWVPAGYAPKMKMRYREVFL